MYTYMYIDIFYDIAHIYTLLLYVYYIYYNCKLHISIFYLRIGNPVIAGYFLFIRTHICTQLYENYCTL